MLSEKAGVERDTNDSCQLTNTADKIHRATRSPPPLARSLSPISSTYKTPQLRVASKSAPQRAPSGSEISPASLQYGTHRDGWLMCATANIRAGAPIAGRSHSWPRASLPAAGPVLWPPTGLVDFHENAHGLELPRRAHFQVNIKCAPLGRRAARQPSHARITTCATR